ncbi:MAG: hypothetical protein JRJ19_14870 [Deltaproteobacteria bacterium]|nr:hypothetical protein [Deltaproteobacteria bacterium]
MIRRAVMNAPIDPTQGTEIYDGLDEQLTDADLQNEITYCYSAFAHDSAGRFAEPATDCQVPGQNQPPPVPAHLDPPNQSLLIQMPELRVLAVVDPQGDQVSYSFELLSETGDQVLETGSGVESDGIVSWSPGIILEAGQVYSWRVEAVDERDAHSGFSNAWLFGIPAAPEGGCGCAHNQPGASLLVLLGLGVCILRRRR